ncbi:unnamed protein product, partial [Rotaria sp. Silwood1]
AIANAYDFCIGDGLASIREKVLNNVKNLKTTETYGLPFKIDLKVGAKYMMTVNIDTEDGLVNGACGKLIMIDYGKLQKTNETVPCRLWIKFSEEKTGRKARANFHNVMQNRNIDLSLTPIEPVTRQINTRSTNFKVERKQFPLVPSEAMTIYKSQGGTYEKVVVNLKKGMTRSELYVACSRATKASGLYLIGDFVPPKPPEPNDAVAMMFKNMRSERMLKFSLEFPEESQEERFSIMFHNVQSLNKHISDIKFDKIFLSSSMISLVETWTKPGDSLEIEGFKIVQRRDCNDIRKPFGQITYLRNDLNHQNILEKYEYSGKNHIEYSSIKIDDICIISVYNSPNASLDVLKRSIKEVITVSKQFCENIIVVEQLKRTAMDTIWGGEVQIQALSIALSHPIYSYIQFNSDPKNRHYISLDISLQELVDRFNKRTAGGHLKYIGYKFDMNKLGFCVYYNGTHYDALLPFQDNPQQFVPHYDLITMSL